MTEVYPDSSNPPTPFELKIRIDRPALLIGYSSLALLIFILVRNLWVSDDAFITLRTVDNFLHGYGLVWNVGERVQTYTHPLWMFVLVLSDLVISDPLYVFYVPSLILSVVTVVTLMRKFAVDTSRTIVAVILLGGSAAFIDFSSSGLENPLTHLLLTLFLVQYLQPEPVTRKRLFGMSLLAGLAALNRLDTLLFYLPALLQLFLQHKKSRWNSALIMFCGFIPLLLWEIFALYYYGFPFPNTFYTKAETGLPATLLFEQGWAYTMNSLHWDPITLGTILAGIASTLFQRETKRIALAAGCAAYLYYILWVGGDFMSGRFFSGTFVMGWVLVMTFDVEKAFGQVSNTIRNLVLVILVFIALSAERPPLFISQTQPGVANDRFEIAYEKFFYFGPNGWINYIKYRGLHEWAGLGMKAAQDNISPIEYGTIGMYGYYAGPKIYIIDTHALADPLRAHIPANPGLAGIGHYYRDYPAGYKETIESKFKENLIEDPGLKLYYDKLSILIHGDLNAPGRIREIFRFNTGYYDSLPKNYWHKIFGIP